MHGTMAQGRDAAAARVEAWNAEVVDNIPPERLLKLRVEDGWEPLCTFLGVEVPKKPFPNVNDKDTFNRNLDLQKREGWALFITGVSAIVALSVTTGRRLRARWSI
jgi:hypothetical protein